MLTFTFNLLLQIFLKSYWPHFNFHFHFAFPDLPKSEHRAPPSREPGGHPHPWSSPARAWESPRKSGPWNIQPWTSSAWDQQWANEREHARVNLRSQLGDSGGGDGPCWPRGSGNHLHIVNKKITPKIMDPSYCITVPISEELWWGGGKPKCLRPNNSNASKALNWL